MSNSCGISFLEVHAKAINGTYYQAVEKTLQTLVATDQVLRLFADIAVGAYGSNRAVLFRYEKTQVSNFFLLLFQIIFRFPSL